MTEQPTVLARGARVWDTAYTLDAMDVNYVLVFRSSQDGLWYRHGHRTGKVEVYGPYESAEAAMNGLTAAEVGE